MTVEDRWAAADAYDNYMGRWSRRLADAYVGWLGAAPGLHWLDVGCGTGALTTAIVGTDPASVVGCDPSEAFVGAARRTVNDPRVSFVVAGAEGMPERDGGFDRIVSGLVLNFIADPAAALAGMRDRTASGGTVSACVWDYAQGMGFLRVFWDEAAGVDPRARELDEGARFPLCDPARLRDLFVGAGLRDVRTEGVEIATRFDSFDDYWAPFLGATGPAPALVASLDEGARAELRSRLERRLGAGPIDLRARAWAVRGEVA